MVGMARRAAQRAASAGPAVSFTPLPTPILRRGTRKGSWQSQRGGNGCRGCRGCIQSPRQKAVRGLIRGRQSCGWLSRQSHAPRWRCAGASILEVPLHPMSIPLSHVIVPPVALGQAWDSSLVAPRQMRSKTHPASQSSPSSAHRHSMILVAYFWLTMAFMA